MDYSIRKEFAPSGSKFFPYRVDSFLKEDKNIDRTVSLKVYRCQFTLLGFSFDFESLVINNLYYFQIICIYKHLKGQARLQQTTFSIISHFWILKKKKKKKKKQTNNTSFKITMSDGRADVWRRSSSKVYLLVNLLKNPSILPLGISEK